MTLKRLSVEIIGGTEASPHSMPFMALIVGDKMCGGTLIKPNWVLTAAHCSVCINTEVILGVHSLSQIGKEQQKFKIKQAVPYPSYNKMTHEHDLKLLQLDKSAYLNRNVAVLSLPTKEKNITVGTKCEVAGWGKTNNEDTSVSDTLMHVTISILDRKVCNDKKHYNFNPVITNNMLCAGDARGGRDTCGGDSGGPLLCNNVLQGITSFGGTICGDAWKPGIYTRLTDQYLQWIKNIIGRNF
ncbi:granzyme A-like [Rhinatrema bivittatum]|uniref:granzyme A-like n=1 Tax=Rhinatrema bivittatum TaxID=194408 RepID=UPI00112A4E59|nr:granzyme A-like [Rhinatrema bivittatum]